MNSIKRIKMVKAMEYIARCLNDEGLVEVWLADGIADGDIDFGDLDVRIDDSDDLEYYLKDKNFAELMETFLCVMSAAYTDLSGLYCDKICSR